MSYKEFINKIPRHKYEYTSRYDHCDELLKNSYESTAPPRADGVCKLFCCQLVDLDCKLISSMQAAGNQPTVRLEAL
jgi:hypothetical protein